MTNPTIRRALLCAMLGAFAAGIAGTAAAQTAYPNRPIRIVVGFPPGGGGDGVARIMGEHMSNTLGKPIIVENRPGAGTTLAPAAVAAAAPDGYTLLLAPDSVFGPDKALFRATVRYDETSFTPITRWASTFFVMATHKGYGTPKLADFVAKAKASGAPDVQIAATQGIYPSIIFHRFNQQSGIKVTQVNYKGGGPSVMAAVAGELPAAFAVPSIAMPMVRDGKLDAVGITAGKRSSLLPDVPTLAEQGMPGFDVGYWFGLAAPAGLPEDIAQKLFDASAQALADPGVRAKLQGLGYEPAPSRSIAEFRAQALADGAALTKLVESLGLKGE